MRNEAATWFVNLLDDDLGLAERRRFMRWLKQSPDHVAEMIRMYRLVGWLPPERE